MLDADELERYARHIVLREVGGPGQATLKAARVLVIGAGGLGAPVLLYLAAAGVGTLGVVDDDTVSLSNLQRQVIHGTADIGTPKVESAGGRDRAAQSACRGRDARERLDARQRARPDRGLRPRRRRLGQFRHALSGVRRLLISPASRWSPRRSAPSTARSPRIRAHERGRRHAAIRPTAACFPSRRRPARCRPAPRPAFSARSPACSAR